MRKAFYWAVLGIIIFEIAAVYFLNPLPGSQKLNAVATSHFLNVYKLWFRLPLYILLLFGIIPALKSKWWLATLMFVLAGWVTYATNFKMTASQMFHLMSKKTFLMADSNKIEPTREVVGVEINGDARAYPIQLIAYHHRVFDTVGGKVLMVTYCTICHTAKVFEPTVRGVQDNFGLIGLDHFNAMFEDTRTNTWWRQANGEAIAGKLKGDTLPVVPCYQMSLQEWLSIHPKSKILQRDPKFNERYDRYKEYETGKIKSDLVGTDTGSWKEKSWVVGVILDKKEKAYDWNALKKKRYILDEINGKRILIWIADKNDGFFVFNVPEKAGALKDLKSNGENCLESGDDIEIRPAGEMVWKHSKKTVKLQNIESYQEFWHSWRTFHPGTAVYKG